MDVINGTLLSGQVVLIEDNRISFVGPEDEAEVPDNTPMINATGQYLIPGLWDMHVHTGNADIFFPLYVANGITGVRDMGGDLNVSTGNLSVHIERLNKWREEVRNGQRMGPELYLAGPMLDGEPSDWPGSIVVTSPEEARAAVASVQKRGSDFVKVYHNLRSSELRAIADETETRGMRFGGHVSIREFSEGMPAMEILTEASRMGYTSMEHLIHVAFAASTNEYHPGPLSEVFNQMCDAVDSIDEDKANALFSLFRDNATHHVPTLSWWWGSGQLDQMDNYEEMFQYLPKHIIQGNYWDPAKDPRYHNFTSADYVAARQSATCLTRLAKRMFDAGVPILAGSDSANPLVFPGFGLHKELELLVSGGFSPAEALRTATINAAAFLNRSDIGAIASGKKADLVLLNDNPLENIQNTRAIEGVVNKGKYYDRDTLDDMLSAVKQQAKMD